MWQLKRLSSNESLNEPQPLPENWGPVFGLAGFSDRLGDLSWLGPDYTDMGWFEVGDAPEEQIAPEPSKEEQVREMINGLLLSSDSKVAADNTDMTAGERAAWLEYRRLLRDIPLQPDFPETVFWPARPE